ncbi:MAG: cytochrome c [Sulfurimonadaceae bacterium]|jgi:mono/diheme cytochrome c family protein|nr:cytochrome c [Sulfurimonadaceae bacterium]
MKKYLLLTLFFALTLVANEGEELAVKHCGECHLMGVTSKEKLDNMKAPPYWALAKKAREAYGTYEEQATYIIEYAKSPNEQMMLFPKQTIEKFGKMPPLKDKISDKELKAIADYTLEDKFN